MSPLPVTEEREVLEPIILDEPKSVRFQESTVWWVYVAILLTLFTIGITVCSHLQIRTYDHVDVYVPLHKNYTGLNPTGSGYSSSP